MANLILSLMDQTPVEKDSLIETEWHIIPVIFFMGSNTIQISSYAS